MKRVTVLLLVLLLVTIFTKNAWAGAQYGTVDFDEAWGGGYVDFAVFDNQADYLNFALGFNIDSGEFASLNENENEYIYAYKITNDNPIDDKAIFSFEVFATGDNAIDNSALIDYFSDSPDEQSEEGVEPTGGYYDSDKPSIVWEFGDSYIQKNEHSWLLMLKSTSAPVAGDFEIKEYEDIMDNTTDLLVPSSDGMQIVPEPATLALLGLGSLVFFRKRKI